MAGGLTPENQRLIEEFCDTLVYLSDGRKRDITAILRVFARKLGKPMDKANKDEVLKALNTLREGTKKSSLRIYATTIRQYYKHLGRKDVVDAIVLPKAHKPKPIYPSGEEFIRIINACHHPRDRCLLAVGYETATAGRANKELLNIRIGDITLKNNTAYIDIRESKTQARRVMVKKFIHDLIAWLNIHPLRDQPEAPLFVTTKWGRNSRAKIYRDKAGREYRRLSYQAARDIMTRACKKAGTKPYTLRSLRHRRAKDLEHVLPLREKMAYFGWSNVGTALIYGSFTSEEACETILAAEEGRPIRRVDEEMESWTCQACKSVNPPTHSFCGVCSQPKDERTAIKVQPQSIDRLVDEVIKRLLVILQDKEIGKRALAIIAPEAQETEATA
jgi:integrase